MSKQTATFAVLVIVAVLILYRTNPAVQSANGIIVSVCLWYGAWALIDWIFDEWGISARPGMTAPASLAAGAAVAWLFSGPGVTFLDNTIVHF